MDNCVIGFINGQFILVNYYDGQLCFTTDGMNWTTKKPISSSYFYDIAYGNGKYVVVGYQSYIAVLTNDFKVESYKWIKDTIDDCWKSIILGNGNKKVVLESHMAMENMFQLVMEVFQYQLMENIGSAQRYKMVVVIIELLLLIRTGSL